MNLMEKYSMKFETIKAKSSRDGLNTLSPEELESFEERSGIIEFDAGLNQIPAEEMALKLILEQRGN